MARSVWGRRVILPVLAMLALALFAPGPTRAFLGLEVAPSKIEFSMPPGSVYNLPITVHNSGVGTTHVQASMVDFTVLGNGNYDFQRVGTRSNSLLRWASINPREFDLPAGTSQVERLTLEIPKSERLSGEYAGIGFFQTRPLRRAGAFAFSTRVATKIYLTIPGTVKMAGEVAKMSARPSPLGELYRVLFRNTGNAHVYLRGTLTVQHDGRTVARIPLQPDEMLVERGGERLIEVDGKRLPPGTYDAIAAIDYGGKTMTGGEIALHVK